MFNRVYQFKVKIICGIKWLYWKMVYTYYYIILRIFYGGKPRSGVFDMKPCPGFKNAVVKSLNE